MGSHAKRERPAIALAKCIHRAPVPNSDSHPRRHPKKPNHANIIEHMHEDSWPELCRRAEAGGGGQTQEERGQKGEGIGALQSRID